MTLDMRLQSQMAVQDGTDNKAKDGSECADAHDTEQSRNEDASWHQINQMKAETAMAVAIAM